jgi:hypothetical protein
MLAPLVLDYSAASSLLWNGILVGLPIVILSWRSATASKGRAAEANSLPEPVTQPGITSAMTKPLLGLAGMRLRLTVKS